MTTSCNSTVNSMSMLLLLLLHAALISAQLNNWIPGQINTSICVWNQPSAAILRDTIYIDGGSIWWTAGLDNGTYGPVANQGNFDGIIFSYNLSRPFDPGTNLTAILLQGSISKARGGRANGNSASPNYLDGGMLANDAQFFLYAGAVFQLDTLYPAPPATAVLSYQPYSYGPDRPLWRPGFHERQLPQGVTRNLASGAAVSAPSENKAWYFSGLAAPKRGPVVSNGAANDTLASLPSNTLITLDMASQMEDKWSNLTLPDYIHARAGSEVVWVPVGSQGLLVVLGGVLYPEWADPDQVSSNEEASKQKSPDFMNTIDIYDIANNTWYKQPTQGAPGTRSRGCAVVAPSADRSSFNIYYYGGFDGIHYTDSFHDDVWVLSLPSFTWTKISDGSPGHARAGHKCFLPYPDQMIIVGGYTDLAGAELRCLQDGPIVLFNLTSSQWLTSYDPSRYGQYEVHQKVQAVIGGTATGHATVNAPLPSGWATAALGDVFATSYNVDKIKTWWPYKSVGHASAGNGGETPPSPSQSPETEESSRDDPSWTAPVLSVVSGLVLVSGGMLIMCIRHRRRRPSTRAATSNDHPAPCEMAVSEIRLNHWIRGQSRHRLPTTITSIDGQDSDAERNALPKTSPSLNEASMQNSLSQCHEMENTEISELGDTSSPVELYGTGLTTADAARRHAAFAPLQTTFTPQASASASATLPSPASQSSGGWSVVSDMTPSTPHAASLPRWPRRMSTISAVSLDSAQRSHHPRPLISVIISPVAPRAGRPGWTADT